MEGRGAPCGCPHPGSANADGFDAGVGTATCPDQQVRDHWRGNPLWAPPAGSARRPAPLQAETFTVGAPPVGAHYTQTAARI
jgi:hypothetical protein